MEARASLDAVQMALGNLVPSSGPGGCRLGLSASPSTVVCYQLGGLQSAGPVAVGWV